MTAFPPPTGLPVTSSSAAAEPTFAPKREPHPTLPIQVAGGAIVVLMVSLFSSKYLLDALITFEWPVVVYVTLLGAIGYGPSLICRRRRIYLHFHYCRWGYLYLCVRILWLLSWYRRQPQSDSREQEYGERPSGIGRQDSPHMHARVALHS